MWSRKSEFSTVEFYYELMHYDVRKYEPRMKICIWNPDSERHLFTCFLTNFSTLLLLSLLCFISEKACFCKPSMGRDDSMRGELANEIYALFIALGILPGFSQRFHLTWSCKSMNTNEVHFCLSKLLAVLRIRVISSCQGSLGRFRSFLSKISIFWLFFQESSFYLLCIQMSSLKIFHNLSYFHVLRKEII